MSKRLRLIVSFVCLLVLWQLCAMNLDNDIILPQPLSVIETMGNQMLTSLFYSSILQTTLRVLIGVSIALIVALIASFLSYHYPSLSDFFYPFLLLTRSVPNISYILIVLFWCSPQTSVMIISFLILFPTIYASLYQGLCDLPQEYKDLMSIYPGSTYMELKHIYLPYLRSHLFASMSAGLSLGLKVGIMAEILGQAGTGIGRQLNICRLNLDMAGVFAWTVWVIILLFIIEQVLSYIQKRTAYD